MSGNKGLSLDPRISNRIPITHDFTHAMRAEPVISDNGLDVRNIYKNAFVPGFKSAVRQSTLARPVPSTSRQFNKNVNKVDELNVSNDVKAKKNRRRERRTKPKKTLEEEPSSSSSNGALRKSSAINTKTYLVAQNRTPSTESEDTIAIQIKHSFVITPAENPQGFLFRLRNIENAYIKLKSFVKYSKTSTFNTEVQKLASHFKNLSIHKRVNKKQHKKYPRTSVHSGTPKNIDIYNEPHCSHDVVLPQQTNLVFSSNKGNEPHCLYKLTLSEEVKAFFSTNKEKRAVSTPSKDNKGVSSTYKENKAVSSANKGNKKSISTPSKENKGVSSTYKENKAVSSANKGNKSISSTKNNVVSSPNKAVFSPYKENEAILSANKENKVPLKQPGVSGSAETEVKKKRKEKRPKRKQKKKEELGQFPEFISFEEVQKGLAEGLLIRGAIRINPKNPRDSYVSNEDSSISDYYITSVLDRNRALDGDEVVLQLKPEKDWNEGKPTATVVYIENRVHPRISVGFIKPLTDFRTEYAIFCPRDKRTPLVRLPPVCWPADFKANSKQFESTLFVVKIVEWDKPNYAIGTIVERLGIMGDLKVETKSILREYCLDVTPFSPNIIDSLPKSKVIPQSEIDSRRDIRKECVFTIDPLTARDLDDALSVKQLSNGNYEIGVHISDASYYLEEGTELDQIVSKKATTIYLVDNVYHMLPVELCLHCSLLPGKDKLAFSVFWEINEQGEIFDTTFTRTVLNSCTQLAYEHAQMMIEDPDKHYEKDELPKIHNGFTAKNLSETVNVLQKIAVNLRQERLINGALRIDQTKLLFSLNPKTGEPLDFRIYENKDAHRLIEEFMLLANISVAEKINSCFPDLAFLRRHEEPKNTMLRELQSSLATCGIHIDISSSGGINASIKKYITEDFAGICRGAVLNHLLAKPMTRAKYFCAGTVEEAQFKHYALSVPIYTHFTSPIRRYADIMVHRLLAACLEYSEKPAWDLAYVAAIAANCNGQKYNAKRAGEASSDLYLAHFIEKHQPYVQNCVVVDVKDMSFDAIVLQTGSIIRLYQKTCEGPTTWKVQPILSDENREQKERVKKVLKLVVTFLQTQDLPEVSLNVEIFTLVKVKLQRKEKTNKLEATLLRPIISQMFSRQ